LLFFTVDDQSPRVSSARCICYQFFKWLPETQSHELAWVVVRHFSFHVARLGVSACDNSARRLRSPQNLHPPASICSIKHESTGMAQKEHSKYRKERQSEQQMTEGEAV
jgi:hypothetical protein